MLFATAIYAAAAWPLRIACVGDSNTYGYRGWLSQSANSYPSVLQRLLGDRAQVINLGSSGTTLQQNGNSPYWRTRNFARLISSEWDCVVIMLGTNDAKDTSVGTVANWPHESCDSATSAVSCSFWADFLAFVARVRSAAPGAQIFVATPPPVLGQGGYGINATVVNTILPRLISAIASDAALSVIDVFNALCGPVADAGALASLRCTIDDAAAGHPDGLCPLYCSSTWCAADARAKRAP